MLHLTKQNFITQDIAAGLRNHFKKLSTEGATGGALEKKVFIKVSQISQANICAGVSVLIKLLAWSLQLYLKETPTQVFPSEFCEVFRNIRATAFVSRNFRGKNVYFLERFTLTIEQSLLKKKIVYYFDCL